MPLPDNPSLDLPMLARAKAVAALAGYHGASEQFLRAARASDRAMRINTKAPVGASGPDSDLDSQVLIGAYTETLRASSAAVRILLDGGFRRVPFNQRLALVTTAPSAGVVAEGAARPVSRIVLGGEVVAPVTVSSLMVLTVDMVRDTSPAGEALFNRELKSVLGAALDAAFFDTLVGDATGAPVIPSSGPQASDALADLRAALMATNALGTPQLFWVVGADTAKMAASLGATGVPVFPSMSATGGELLGIPAIVSSGIAADELILVEGSCVAANIGAIEVLPSISADIEMSNTPTHDATTPTGTGLVSMFGTNSVAMRGTVVFGVQALRDNAVVRIEGIEWGG